MKCYLVNVNDDVDIDYFVDVRVMRNVVEGMGIDEVVVIVFLVNKLYK